MRENETRTTWVPDTSLHRGDLLRHPATREVFVVQQEAPCSENIEDLVWVLRSTHDGRDLPIHDRELSASWLCVPRTPLSNHAIAELSACAHEMATLSGYAQGIVQRRMREVASRLRALVTSVPDEPGKDPGQV